MSANRSESTSAVSPTAYPGMGTILIPGGVAFRVWAPFASEVFAAGTFNQWSTTANPFASEGNGYWSVEVRGAKIGDEYQFAIRNGAQPLYRRKNPYASEVVNSSGNGIIHDPNFDWTGDDFTMPPWMGHPHPRGKETRPGVALLRKIAEEHKVALADTSRRWEHLANHPQDDQREVQSAILRCSYSSGSLP